MNPKLLLLDEALSSLDAKLRVKMRSEIKEIGKVFNTTMIFVTHDQEEALSVSDKIAVMNNGCIQQIEAPRELYENPSNDFVRDFIGESNNIKIDDKNISIRPEKVILLPFNDEEKDFLSFGTVCSVAFIGFYIQYEVILKETKEKLIAKTFNKDRIYCLDEQVKIVIK